MSIPGSKIEFVVYAVLGGVLVLYLFALMAFSLRRQREPSPRFVSQIQCRSCGYSIVSAAFTFSRCSECGSVLDQAGLRKKTPPRTVGFPLRWCIWTLIAFSLVWPVKQVLSSPTSQIAAGWWEASFLLNPAASSIQPQWHDSIYVNLVCAENGAIGTSVLPCRVLLTMKREGVVAQPLLIDVREGLCWPADLSWNIQGPSCALEVTEVADRIRAVMPRNRRVWIGYQEENILQQASFIYNYISSMKAVKLDTNSARTPWIHAAVDGTSIQENGIAHRVARQQIGWLSEASWLIVGVTWLSGSHLLWLRIGR